MPSVSHEDREVHLTIRLRESTGLLVYSMLQILSNPLTSSHPYVQVACSPDKPDAGKLNTLYIETASLSDFSSAFNPPLTSTNTRANIPP